MAAAAVPSEVTAVAAAPPVRYVGLATRAIAMALDAAVINLVAIVLGIGASLILSLLHLPSVLKPVLVAIGGAAYILWAVGYFIVFWSTTGQTPGGRVMQFRVMTADGSRFTPTRALIRCVGTLLAALPLFAGFVLILFDDKRRGFQDRFAGTVVVEAPETSFIAARRAGERASTDDSRPTPPTPPG